MFHLGYGKAELYTVKVKVNFAACTSFSASLLSFCSPALGLVRQAV